jgi:hypothetical protein
MAQAWMVRSLQQRRFIKKMVGEFHAWVDTVSDSMVRELAAKNAANLTKLLLLQMIAGKKVSFSGMKEEDEEESWGFWQEVQEHIRKFSRAQEEEVVLSWRFFREIVNFLTSIYESDLSRLEHTDPQKIFRASSSTVEVELDNED